VSRSWCRSDEGLLRPSAGAARECDGAEECADSNGGCSIQARFRSLLSFPSRDELPAAADAGLETDVADKLTIGVMRRHGAQRVVDRCRPAPIWPANTGLRPDPRPQRTEWWKDLNLPMKLGPADVTEQNANSVEHSHLPENWRSEVEPDRINRKTTAEYISGWRAVTLSGDLVARQSGYRLLWVRVAISSSASNHYCPDLPDIYFCPESKSVQARMGYHRINEGSSASIR